MSNKWVACPDCDALVSVPSVPSGARAICPRCDAVLVHRGQAHDLALHLTVAGFFLWAASLLMPVLNLDINGVSQSVSLLQASLAMLEQQEWLLAMLVAMTTVVAPAVQLGALLWLLMPIAQGRKPLAVGWVFRVFHLNQGWLMLDVFFLGLLVTAVKLSDMAQVIPGWSLLAFIGLMLTMSAIAIVFDIDAYWQAVDAC